MEATKILIVAAAALFILASVTEARINSDSDFLVLWNGAEDVKATAGLTVTAAESLNCKGSTLCGGIQLPNGGQCDTAKRMIQPGNRYFTGGAKGSTGVCSGHCGLFVSGTLCDLQGTEMITAFDQLRNNGCKICGVKTFDDGCQFKMDFVTGC